VKANLILLVLLFNSNLQAQSTTYAPGIIQISDEQRNAVNNGASKSNSTKAGSTASSNSGASASAETISPDDPFYAQKSLKAQYKLQIAQLQAHIETLDKQINSAGSTTASASSTKSNNSNSTTANQTSVAAGGSAGAMINNARQTYSKVNIADSVPVIRTTNGPSTTLTCPTGYMYHNPDGNRLNGNEVCIPIPTTASSSTVTPGNVPIPAVKSARGTLDQCPEGYIATSSPNDNYQTIMCTPRITEIAPGKYSCLFGEEWPELDANGKMNCVGAVNKNGSARVCSDDAITNQGCAPGYFYSKKTKQYYPTQEAASAASGYASTSGSTSTSTTSREPASKPSNEDIKKYLLAYKEDITKPENIARIKKDAKDNGVSAAELDSIMGWQAGTAQGAFDGVP